MKKQFNPEVSNTCISSPAAAGGVYGSVRMGTENYGASAPQQTACVYNTKNTPLFLKRERGRGGKRKLFFL